MAQNARPKTGPASLTARDQELLVIGIAHCLQNPDGFKIDAELLAKHAGFKNKATASVIWNSMKKKLLGGAVHGKPKPVNKCSKNTIASNGIRAEINDESADDEETAPSKPPKKRTCKPKDLNATPKKRAKKRGAFTAVNDIDGDDEAVKNVDAFIKDEYLDDEETVAKGLSEESSLGDGP